MYNHIHVIEKLTNKQKFSLLTDIQSLSRPEMNSVGVPYVSVQTLDQLMAEQYEGLSPYRLANSWDSDLIQSIGYQATAGAHEAQPGAKLLMTPAAKPQLNVYQKALSEDPFLAGTLSAAYADGVHRAGSGSCLDGFYLTDGDVEQLDIRPDMAVIGEMILRPYILAAEGRGYSSIIAPSAPLKAEYRDVNERLATATSAVNIFNGAVRLCRPQNANDTLTAILDGKVVIKGASSALESAYDNYHYIMKAIEEEIVTVEDLDEALSDGRALSDEMLNKAVDRVLDFAASLASASEQNGETSHSSRQSAFTSSAVLLKNEKEILPLKKKCRLAIIGHPAAPDALVAALSRKKGLTVVGQLGGYDPLAVAGGVDAEGVKKLAAAADRVLVFLGCNEEASRQAIQQREMTLPAGQAELLHVLAPYKDKVIGILDCEYAPDMTFASDVAALVLATVGGVESTEALAELLIGNTCPSGKLACTLYENTTDHFARLRRYKNTEKNKVGQFLGYRHYDSAGIDVKFPFGHGLSYTTFKYTKLKVTPGQVVFKVKNTGSVAGDEIAQVYIGKPSSARLRPCKELCGFAKLHLKPGETKEVRVDISHVSFYDAEADAWVRESGDYTVYVGASVKDVRLEQSLRMEGSPYTPSEEKTSDYLQTHTNILSGGFVVELKRAKPPRFWGLRVIAVIVLLLAVAMGGAGHVLAWLLPNLIPDFIMKTVLMIGYICGGIFLAGVIAIFAVTRHTKKRSKKKQEADADMAIEKHLETAEEKEFTSIEELFVEEFDNEPEVAETVVEEKAYVDDTSRYIDLNYTLKEAAEDLAKFMQTQGIQLSAAEAIRLMSAMAASRLAVIDLKGMDRERFYAALATYFDSPACIDTVRKEYLDTHMMFRTGEDGGFEKTDLVKLVESAKEKVNSIHLAILRGVRAGDLVELFMPYTKYINNPLRENRIIVKNPTATFTLPSNLWFMVELAEGEQFDATQASILKVATCLQMNVAEVEKTAEAANPIGLGYYQFDHLVQQQRNRFVMDEDLWKKIDALEAYTAGYATFHIGNKQWLQMEKYLSLLIAAESDMAAALDRALCVNLLPVVMALVKGKIASGDPDLLETLDRIFGEDNVPLCVKAVKHKDVPAPTSQPIEEKVEEKVDEQPVAENKTEAAVETTAETTAETVAEVAVEVAVEVTVETTEEAAPVAEPAVEPAEEPVAEVAAETETETVAEPEAVAEAEAADQAEGE